MPIDDKLIIDPREMPELDTPEQASNFIQEKIHQARDLIKHRPPPPTNNLQALEYLRWERRLMIMHGQCIGALQALQAFNLLSIPQFQVLKGEILGTFLRKAADVQLGVERYDG